MVKLNRKQWNALGKTVEQALTTAEKDQAVHQQALLLGDALQTVVSKKLGQLGRGGRSLPGATYVLAGLHLMHILTDAAIPFDEGERSRRIADAWDRLLKDSNREPSPPAPVVPMEIRPRRRRSTLHGEQD